MNDNFLSPDGRDRRARILTLAIGEARRRRRRGWIAPGAVGVIIGCILVAIFSPVDSPPSPRAIKPPVAVAPQMPPASQPSVVIEFIATDPTITDRLSIRPGPPRWTSIGDDDLLKELAAAGQPAGLAYVNGKAMLLPRGVKNGEW